MSELNGIYAQYRKLLVNVTITPPRKSLQGTVLAGFIENRQQKLMGMGAWC